jgi:hypothetical protein
MIDTYTSTAETSFTNSPSYAEPKFLISATMIDKIYEKGFFAGLSSKIISWGVYIMPENDIVSLKVSTGKIETNVEHILKALDKIQANTDKIPVIENEIKHIQGDMDKLEKKKKWWQQYLLLPLITGVIGGIVVALLIALFKIK